MVRGMIFENKIDLGIYKAVIFLLVQKCNAFYNSGGDKNDIM